MRFRDAAWLGWAVIAGVVSGLVALYTLRNGIVPAGDGVSYHSASVTVSHGHLLQSSLVPAFSDLSFRDLWSTGRTSFVDFPIGYPLIVGSLGAVVGISAAQILLMIMSCAATGALFVIGPTRAANHAQLATRMIMGWVAISVPLAVQLRQGALPEPLFVAGLLAFALAVSGLGSDRSLLLAAALGGALGVLRFVGLPLVIVLGAAAWRAGARRWNLARAMLICGLPGLLNAGWASRVTGRQPQLMDRAAIDTKFAAHSIAGWFTTSKTLVDDVLNAPWRVPGLYYLMAAAALVTIGACTIVWMRHRSPDSAPLLTAIAAALVVGVVITMFFYDALTKFEPRMMYPPGVLLFAAWAWSSTMTRKLGVAVPLISLVWAISASWPSHWQTPRFSANQNRVAAARSLQVRTIISNSADLVHFETGISAAYFPSSIKVHSGRAQDRDALMVDFPCGLQRHQAAVLLDGSGFLPPDPWVLDTLDRFVNEGSLARSEVDQFVTFAPTATACAT